MTYHMEGHSRRIYPYRKIDIRDRKLNVKEEQREREREIKIDEIERRRGENMTGWGRTTKMQQYSPSMVLVQLGCIISQKFSATLGSTTLAEAYHFLATTLIMPLDTSRIPNLGLGTCIILDRRLRLVCRFKLETRGSEAVVVFSKSFKYYRDR